MSIQHADPWQPRRWRSPRKSHQPGHARPHAPRRAARAAVRGAARLAAAVLYPEHRLYQRLAGGAS